MIVNFITDDKKNLVKQESSSVGVVPIWLDVFNPTREERSFIESEYGVVLPHLNETVQIEYSNRFYEEQGVIFLSVTVMTKVVPYPESQVITFILTKDKLITLRYSNPSPLAAFVSKLTRHSYIVHDALEVLVLLLQQIVGGVANIFEMLGASTDLLSLTLMQTIDMEKHRDHAKVLNNTLKEIGKFENILSKGYQSLASVSLLTNYFERSSNAALMGYSPRFDSLARDVAGLVKHADYLTQKLEFQLESTLGLLNIEQTYIIKMFTVLAMIFMPPTLIASIYGMNFHFMPELNIKMGYPFAILLMFISALFPYRFFKKRGWI